MVTVESGWNTKAVSPVGAVGLAQLMPSTAKGLGVNPHNPTDNLKGAVKYNAGLMRRFGGNMRMVIASYNAGPSAVKRYNGIPPYKETINHVRKVCKLAGCE